MTIEYMTVMVEAWGVAGDPTGLWLVSGDGPWRPDLPVPADSEPHAEAELLLGRHHALNPLVVLHSPSWRPEQGTVIITYVAVIGPAPDRDDQEPWLVLDDWPAAVPLGPALAAEVGRAPRHDPTGPAVVRDIDVLLHAVRHLRFLDDTDADVHEVLTADWHRHLAGFAPALAGMYGRVR